MSPSRRSQSPFQSIAPDRRRSAAIARSLLRWYDRERRSLPWRGAGDPYAVLVSEFMLQQTQVATAIPYYRAFMRAFPTVESLARAQEEEVLRLWGGLGYYRRARNLHAAARKIVGEYGSETPSEPAELLFLPGVGPYIAGAVASIAFSKPAPAVDANVARVICRLFALRENPQRPAVRRGVENLVSRVIPRKRPGDFNQALMDLGASLCTAERALCSECPLEKHCEGCLSGSPLDYPALPKRRDAVEVEEAVAVVRRGERYLVARRSERSGRYRGMWEFPSLPLKDPQGAERELTQRLDAQFGIRAKIEEEWAEIRHRVTHHNIRKRIFLCTTESDDAPGEENLPSEIAEARWATLEEIAELPLAAPQKRVLNLLLESRDLFAI